MQTVKDTMVVLLLTNLLSYHNGSANTLIRVHTVHKIWRATAAELNEQPLLAIKTIWLPGFPKYWRWLSLGKKTVQNPT